MSESLDGITTRVAIIGGGVVGCSILYHLARAGWTDAVLLERDELTSGSSWHAAGSLFSLTTPSNAAFLQKYAIDLYPHLQQESGQDCGFHRTGELWLACSREEVKSLKIFQGLGRRQGLQAEFLSAEEACRLSPILNPDGLLGALLEHDAGHCDPASVTHAFAIAARNLGARVYRFTPVTGTRQRKDGSWNVVTGKGTMHAEYVVNAAGLWAREVAALAGITMPLMPVEHHYMVTGAIPEIAGRDSWLPGISYSEANVYARQEGDGLLVGAYESNCTHWAENGTPLDFGHELLPDDLERMEDNLARAMERIPCLETAGIKRVINGPMIFSPDLGPLLGPHPALRNYFCATGVMTGFNQAPGIGKLLAEWIIEGETSMDVSFWDVARFGPWASQRYTRARTRYWYEHRSTRVYPYEDIEAGRPLAKTPIYEDLHAAGAVFAGYNGCEDPVYFARNEAERTPRYAFERPGWFDAAGDEARAVHSAAGLFDFSTFAKYWITGPEAGSWLDRMCANRIPARDSKSALMPMLSPAGRVIGDFTLTRFGDEAFLLIGAGGMQHIHMRWFCDHLPEKGVTIENRTDSWAGLHIAGPASREILAAICGTPLANDSFPFLSGRQLALPGCPQAIALRVSFTGELGYELYMPRAGQQAVYRALLDAGKTHGLKHCGSHALMSLRLEKAFPSWGLELSSDYYPEESGLGRFVALDKGDFCGRRALSERTRQDPREKIGLFIVDAGDADACGGEPVFLDGALAGYLTSGGYGYRTGKSLALGYLQAGYFDPSREYSVEILGSRRPARLNPGPLYDPRGILMKS